MPLDKTQPGIAEIYAELVQTSQIGTGTGQIPVIPVPMASMSTPVKSTIDAITAKGGPTWIAALANAADVASAVAAEAAARAAAISSLTPNKASATVDFGYASGNGEGDFATTTVSASWVSSTSRIVCRCAPNDSADHTTDETIAEGITFDAVNIINGVSFDVKAFAPNGTWGRHNCAILGL